MINDKEKYIYNSFLKISRTVKNKPYNFRQNFSTLDNTTCLYLKKLSSFFSTYQNISFDDFFIAPYKVYEREEYFDLHFFCTRRALKCYTEYIKQRETSDTESDNTIEFCKECCKHIYKFCKEQELTLNTYKTAISGTTPIVLQHLKDHKINFYVLHGLGVQPQGKDESFIYEFAIPEFYKTYNTTKQKFLKSKRLKDVIRTALKLVDEKLLIYENNKLQ